MNCRRPAKVLRSVVWITKKLETKSSALSVSVQPSLNIVPLGKQLNKSLPILTSFQPQKKILSVMKNFSISIPPSEVKPKVKQKLTFVRCSQTDLAPDPLPCIFCKLVSPFPNLPRTPTGPVPICCVCTKPVDDRFDPHFCCDQVMHQLCLGGHLCDDWE